jgi:sugar transferase EpsL
MYRRIKRPLDVVGACVMLVATAPLILLIALGIRFKMGRPLLFRQMRPGLNEQLFSCLKFRTMNNDCDSEGNLLTDAKRTTPLGAFLRRTSLDELPQLWNILRGDLSFIGPRPLLVRYLPHYSQEERRRHSVRPGLTGWAQIHGRNHLCFDKRLVMDVWYVDHVSFGLDLRILIRTLWIVLTQHGVDFETTTLDELRSPRSQRAIKYTP